MGFADDLALTIVADTQQQLEYVANRAIKIVGDWMVKKKLELATQKTKAIILCGPRKRNSVCFNIEGVTVRPVKKLKYLGIVIDINLGYGPHVEYVVEKAEKAIASLGRLLPRVRGPETRVRKIMLNGVANAIMLYAAPVWFEVRKVKKYKDKLLSAQRKSLIKMTSAYRTTSTPALQVVASEPPLDLLAQERYVLFQRSKNENITLAIRQQERRWVMRRWRQ